MSAWAASAEPSDALRLCFLLLFSSSPLDLRLRSFLSFSSVASLSLRFSFSAFLSLFSSLRFLLSSLPSFSRGGELSSSLSSSSSEMDLERSSFFLRLSVSRFAWASAIAEKASDKAGVKVEVGSAGGVSTGSVDSSAAARIRCSNEVSLSFPFPLRRFEDGLGSVAAGAAEEDDEAGAAASDLRVRTGLVERDMVGAA